MPTKDPAEIVRRYYATYLTRDRAEMESLIAEDFSFTSPYDDAISREAFFIRCWPRGEHMNALTVEHVVADGESAYVTYLLSLKNGPDCRNTEYVTIKQGRIVRIDVYFGAEYKDGKLVRPTN